jgi:hypothetical protein
MSVSINLAADGSLAYQKVRFVGDEMQDWLVIVRENRPVGKCAKGSSKTARLKGVSFRLRQAGEGRSKASVGVSISWGRAGKPPWQCRLQR